MSSPSSIFGFTEFRLQITRKIYYILKDLQRMQTFIFTFCFLNFVLSFKVKVGSNHASDAWDTPESLWGEPTILFRCIHHWMLSLSLFRSLIRSIFKERQVMRVRAASSPVSKGWISNLLFIQTSNSRDHCSMTNWSKNLILIPNLNRTILVVQYSHLLNVLQSLP